MSHYDNLDLNRFRSWASHIQEISVKSYGDATARYKQDGSLVTQVDEEVEDFLASEISKYYPDHRVLGEERGSRSPSLNWNNFKSGLWIIDPIDGTEVYYSKLPTYANSIALYHGKKCHYAAINLPGTDQKFEFWKGNPLLDQLPLPSVKKFHSNMMASSHYAKYFNVPEDIKVRALGSICFHGCSLLQGQCQAVLINKASIWDLAALWPMLQSRGFIMLRKDGQQFEMPLDPSQTSIDHAFLITHQSLKNAVLAKV